MFAVLATGPNRRIFLIFLSLLDQILFFLQETLAARPAAIDILKTKWSGKSFWSPALGKQGGVAILVRTNTDFEIRQWKKDSSGRIISLLACLGDAL